MIKKNKGFNVEKQEKNDVTEESNDINLEEGQENAQPTNKEDESNAVVDLTEQVEILQDKLLRQLAESENIRTRGTMLADEAREYAVLGFAKDLVPVMDNLSRALEHLPENLSEDVKNMVAGIEMTKSELASVFKKHGLESIEPQSGDKFDYNLHHAISQVATDEYKAGSVVNTMQSGYKIKSRLIRPAAVTVAKKD